MNRILITAISFFLALAMGLVFIQPKYQELKLIEEKIEARRAELQSKEDYLQKLKDTSQKLDQYRIVELSIIDSSLPPDASLPNLLDFLQKTSSENGLVLKTTKRTGVSLVPDSEIKETKLSLQLIGDYPSLKNFLQTLEKTARLIEVDSISFSAPDKPDLFTFDIIIKIHSY